MSQTRDDLSVPGLVLARTCPDGWSPTGRPYVVGNAPGFVDELRWTQEVVAVRLLPAAGHPQAAVVPRPALPWGRGTS